MSTGGNPLSGFLLEDEAWMNQGICRIEKVPTEVFILDQGYTAAEAKTYCDRCPVILACRAYARRTGSVGVWGGKVFSFKAEVPDITPRPVMNVRPAIRRVVYFEPGKAPGILGNGALTHKPGILG